MGIVGFAVGRVGSTWAFWVHSRIGGFNTQLGWFPTGKVGSQMGKSGFPNGDGDCQSDRQARDFKLFARFPNEEIWVPKWGSVGPQRGPAGSQRAHSGARWVHSGARWVHSGGKVGSQQRKSGFINGLKD